MAEWNEPTAQAGAWLMYSANYLLRTGGVRCAIDPVRLQHRLADAPAVDYPHDLKELSFVLLTHRHGDHLDPGLIRLLRHLPITWIVPEPMRKIVQAEGGIRANQIIVPKPLQPIELHGVRVTPFEGLHWEDGALLAHGERRGVPAMGYLTEFDGKRWLFPGDTRTYDASRLPCFGPVDGLVAHVWLGRGAALDVNPSMVQDFSRWCLDLRPARIVLTHLQEFGRDAADYWDVEHAEIVCSMIRELRPGIPVVWAAMGDRISL